MARHVGSKNTRYRVAKRDAKRIDAIAKSVTIARAFHDGFSPDERGQVAGHSATHARRLLVRSMTEVAAMPDAERERLKCLPAPPAEGTQLRRALELRAAGRPYHEIADELGICESRAAHYVAEALERLRGEEVRHADVARHLELARLDAMFAAHWDGALAGNVRETETCLKIMDRRAKYLGLDAPVKVDISHRIPELARQYGVTEEELRAELPHVIKGLPT